MLNGALEVAGQHAGVSARPGGPFLGIEVLLVLIDINGLLPWRAVFVLVVIMFDEVVDLVYFVVRLSFYQILVLLRQLDVEVCACDFIHFLIF